MSWLTNAEVDYYEAIGAKCSDCQFQDDCHLADGELCNDFTPNKFFENSKEQPLLTN